jgi:uncharacterized secreted protein with C-terminal beta-propeller domain
MRQLPISTETGEKTDRTEVIGEVTIPGFSDYIHHVDDGYLLIKDGDTEDRVLDIGSL